MSINWAVELPLIKAECSLYGTDFLVPILMAIRHTENGSDGKQYGVLSVSAPTYAEQLHIACKTVLHRLSGYLGNPLITTPTGILRVSDNWVAYFASIWAPIGVSNDSKYNVNRFWVTNFLNAYSDFIKGTGSASSSQGVGGSTTIS